jgi:hypothetical protein
MREISARNRQDERFGAFYIAEEVAQYLQTI